MRCNSTQASQRAGTVPDAMPTRHPPKLLVTLKALTKPVVDCSISQEFRQSQRFCQSFLIMQRMGSTFREGQVVFEHPYFEVGKTITQES